MKKLLLAVALLTVLTPSAFAAFASNVVVLDKADVVKLSDEKLVDVYTDVVVELEAIRTFHATSGFSPKQYDEFRELLKYRLKLLMEIHARNIEIPQQMERL